MLGGIVATDERSAARDARVLPPCAAIVMMGVAGCSSGSGGIGPGIGPPDFTRAAPPARTLPPPTFAEAPPASPPPVVAAAPPPSPRPEAPPAPRLLTSFEPVPESYVAPAPRVPPPPPDAFFEAVPSAPPAPPPSGPPPGRYVMVGPEYFDADLAPYVVSVARPSPAATAPAALFAQAPPPPPAPRPEPVIVAQQGWQTREVRSESGRYGVRVQPIARVAEVAPEAPPLPRRRPEARPLPMQLAAATPQPPAPPPPPEPPVTVASAPAAPRPPSEAEPDPWRQEPWNWSAASPLREPEGLGAAPTADAAPELAAVAPPAPPEPVRVVTPPADLAEPQPAVAPADCRVARGASDRMVLVCRGNSLTSRQVFRAVVEGETALAGQAPLTSHAAISSEFGFHPDRFGVLVDGPATESDLAFLRALSSAATRVRVKNRRFDVYLMRGDEGLATVMVERPPAAASVPGQPSAG